MFIYSRKNGWKLNCCHECKPWPISALTHKPLMMMIGAAHILRKNIYIYQYQSTISAHRKIRSNLFFVTESWNQFLSSLSTTESQSPSPIQRNRIAPTNLSHIRCSESQQPALECKLMCGSIRTHKMLYCGFVIRIWNEKFLRRNEKNR